LGKQGRQESPPGTSSLPRLQSLNHRRDTSIAAVATINSGSGAVDLRIRIQVPVDAPVGAGGIDSTGKRFGGGLRRRGGVTEESFQDQEIFRRERDG
jgi:hypothetical protein